MLIHISASFFEVIQVVVTLKTILVTGIFVH